MRKPLWNTVGFTALFLMVPALCLAQSARTAANLKEFDQAPRVVAPCAGSRTGACQNSPASAVKMIRPQLKAPAAATPLYPPNVVRNPRAAQAGTTSLGTILSFLTPAKKDLDRCFEAEDKALRNRDKSQWKPFWGDAGKH